jgi:hypothetical protein
VGKFILGSGRYHFFSGKKMAIEEKIHLSLEISPQLYTSLDTLAKKIGTDQADVLLKAITFLELAVEAKEQGMEIKIVGKDKNLALKSE